MLSIVMTKSDERPLNRIAINEEKTLPIKIIVVSGCQEKSLSRIASE